MEISKEQRDAFIARCREAGLSVTHQRLAIFEAVMANCNRHPSADLIYRSVRERYPTISFNTIYKNLETVDVHDEELDRLPSPQAADDGFVVENWTVQFTGLCAECRTSLAAAS